jgi:hypothetical protein
VVLRFWWQPMHWKLIDMPPPPALRTAVMSAVVL